MKEIDFARGATPWRRTIRHIVGKMIGTYAPAALLMMTHENRDGKISIKSHGDFVDVVCCDRIIRISKSNYVYLPQIVDNFDLYFTSVEPVFYRLGKAFFQVVDFSTPRFHCVSEFPDFPLLSPGVMEPYKTTRQYLDFAQLQPGHVVIDLGAHSGLTSIAFARQVGVSGRVVAVEPDPLTVTACRVNIARSGCSQITLVAKAIAPAPGRVRLSSEGGLGSALASLVGSHRGVVVDVDAITLDQLMQDHRLERVDFIKMDIEGAEAWVLEGARAFLQRYRPKLIVEPHMAGGRSTLPAMQSLLGSQGYRCELIDQHESRTLPLLAASPVEGD